MIRRVYPYNGDTFLNCRIDIRSYGGPKWPSTQSLNSQTLMQGALDTNIRIRAKIVGYSIVNTNTIIVHKQQSQHFLYIRI